MKNFFALLIPYLLFFFSPIVMILFTTGVLVFTDMITGIFAAKKRGEITDSKKMARSISKIIFYFIAILLSRIMEITFIHWLPLANITAGYIALVEFKSNFENIHTITGLNIWKVLINKINNQKPQ